jgi:hypothetical protein
MPRTRGVSDFQSAHGFPPRPCAYPLWVTLRRSAPAGAAPMPDRLPAHSHPRCGRTVSHGTIGEREPGRGSIRRAPPRAGQPSEPIRPARAGHRLLYYSEFTAGRQDPVCARR